MHTAPFWRRAVGARLSRVQRLLAVVFSLFLGTLLVVTLFASRQSDAQSFSSDHGDGDRSGRVSDYARDLLEEGRRAFRSDAFGDEKFWGDACAGLRPGPTPPSFAPAMARCSFRGRGAVRHVPRASALYRAWLEHAHTGRDWHRQLSSRSIAGWALPYSAARRALGASEGAAFIMTADSRRSGPSSIITMPPSGSVCRLLRTRI
jgi:hypothetical protein